uniref:Uncharacterized protein n=1 Tax=Romanomermis culicivorax TaxID=13658 RepID=A0A915HZX5_ROMCU
MRIGPSAALISALVALRMLWAFVMALANCWTFVDEEAEEAFVGCGSINCKWGHIVNNYFDSASFFSLLSLKLVRDGANNLVNCLHCRDVVGDSCHGSAKLLKGIVCFNSKIVDFIGVCYGQTTVVIGYQCWGGGWGLQWINIDERVGGNGAGN